MPLQIRRGTNAERVAMTQPLAAGELLWITDDQRLYVGNGSTLPSSLVSITGYTNENAQDAAATLFTTGTHRSISFAYNDSLNRIDATVDLSAYNGPIDGDLIGSVFADNSTRLVDGVSGKINLNGTIDGHVVPDQNSVYDLGSNANKFRDLYLSGSTIFLGSASITSTGSAVNLPAGSTVNGVLIGSGTGSGDGVIEGSTYKINIAADDSSIMLDTDLETVTASGGFFGNVTGNVTGNVSGSAGSASVAVTLDITDTNGLTTVYYPTFIENRTVGQTVRADVDLTYRTDTNTLTASAFAGNLTGNVTGNLTGNVNGNVVGDIRGSLFADNSSLLVDGIDGVFYGIIDTGSTVLNSDSLVSTGLFSMGSITELLDLRLNLSNNLQIHQIINPANPKGYITTTLGRGTVAAPAAAQAGDELGGLLIRAYTNSSSSAIAGIIGVLVDPTSTVTSGSSFIKSQILISAATDTTQNEADAFVLDSAGVASSNAFEATKYFQMPVYADDAARSTAIPTPAKGMMVFMTSGTAPAVTNKTVVYDGSAWTTV